MREAHSLAVAPCGERQICSYCREDKIGKERLPARQEARGRSSFPAIRNLANHLLKQGANYQADAKRALAYDVAAQNIGSDANEEERYLKDPCVTEQ